MKQRVPFSSIISLWGLGKANTNKTSSVYVCMVRRQASVRDVQIRRRLSCIFIYGVRAYVIICELSRAIYFLYTYVCEHLSAILCCLHAVYVRK